MDPPPPKYSSIVKPSAPPIDNSPPPRPPSVIPSVNPSVIPTTSIPPMVYPAPVMVPPPIYAQPVYGYGSVPMQTMAPPPVTNIVINSGSGGTGQTAGGGSLSPLLCPKCKTGVLIKQRNSCIKVTIIVLIVITFPFGLLLIPFLCCIWQKKCPVCLRVSGSPIGMKNSR